MNSVHDMGGMHGFGPVLPEPNEPVFHAPWEGRVLAMHRAMGYTKAWSLDDSRYAQEQLPPVDYLAASYYQRWTLGMMHNLTRLGLVSEQEVRAGHALEAAAAPLRVMHAADISSACVRGKASRPTATTPKFQAGDAVRTQRSSPKTHTRLPRYARGCVGVIETVHGCHVFPDSNASGAGENPQWLYTVVFSARTLFGDRADPMHKVSIEAFEPYLELA